MDALQGEVVRDVLFVSDDCLPYHFNYDYDPCYKFDRHIYYRIPGFPKRFRIFVADILDSDNRIMQIYSETVREVRVNMEKNIIVLA